MLERAAGGAEDPGQEIPARLKRLFEETLNIPAPAPEEDIIERGILDSLGLVTLLFEIEQEFGLQIPLESLEIDDFRSLAGIARLLTSSVPAP
ncbi:MAG: acyl carrier protein [Solirubrobacterales bacterium]